MFSIVVASKWFDPNYLLELRLSLLAYTQHIWSLHPENVSDDHAG